MKIGFAFATALCFFITASLLSGCTNSADKERLIQGPAPFHYLKIDPQGIGGKECCSDVLIISDITGDGFKDIIVGAENGGDQSLVYYQYPSWKKSIIAAKGQFTTDGEAADINKDGHNDIIISNNRKGIFWYENRMYDDQAKTQWIPHYIGGKYAHDISVADMDGDGDLDVVSDDKKELVLWRQIGIDQWQSEVLLTYKGEGLDVGDLDGDNDVDIAFSNQWIENKLDGGTQQWVAHPINSHWSTDTRSKIADINADGKKDIVLTVSEGTGSISWYERNDDGVDSGWREHVVDSSQFEGVHSLEIADFDHDGNPDILVAEMHTSPQKRILIYFNDGQSWNSYKLGVQGSHNMVVADIGNDGDIDIVGKNYGGTSRPVELWENLFSDYTLYPKSGKPVRKEDMWPYSAIDDQRGDDQKEKMGLVLADIDHDGYTDVVAGSILYLNPNPAGEKWKGIDLGEGLDAYFSLDVDLDKDLDIVGIANDVLVWRENNGTGQWPSHPIGKVPQGRTQGHKMADIFAGGREELVFTRGHHLLYALVPDKDFSEPWKMGELSTETEEEGIDIGDIDQDGDLDISAVDKKGHHLIWLENDGKSKSGWPVHVIGDSIQWSDRVALADINNDGHLDLVSTEESRNWYYNSSVYWFEAPAKDPRQPWQKHVLVTLRSVNSLSVQDMNNDGLQDIVIAEHTDLRNHTWKKNNLVMVLNNQNSGANWLPEVVEIGEHSSHLGAQVADIDNDNDLDIVSLGWEQYCCVHLWRNPAVR